MDSHDLDARIACCGLLLACSALATAESPEDGTENGERETEHDVEIVTVTGTHIRDSSHDSPSPVRVVSREQIDAYGAFDIKDIIGKLNDNTASIGQSHTNWYGDDSSTGEASINLRNLGNGATLLLIDGRRTATTNYDNNGAGYADIQSLVPNILIDRIEVLRDGASALYGADAVAGVVNFITRDASDGLSIQLDTSTDHESGEARNVLISGLWGTSDANRSLLIGVSHLDRAGLFFSDRYERFGRSGLSSFGQPGRYVPMPMRGVVVPVDSNYWWPRGGADPSSFAGSLPDPECERAAADDGPMGTLGLHPDFPHICVYDYAAFFALERPGRQSKVHLSGRWSLDGSTEWYAQASFADLESSRGNSFYPDVRYVIVPEHNFGLQLDAARRGFEAVPYQALQRVLGGTNHSSFEDRPVSTVSTSEKFNSRFVVGLNTLFKGWTVDANLVYSTRDASAFLPTDTLSSRMDAAFKGYGGPNCNRSAESPGSGNLGIGDCWYYNSFQTSVYDPVTGTRWQVSDGSPWAADPTLTVSEAARKYMNPPDLLAWVQGARSTDAHINQLAVEIVAFGEIAYVDAGAVRVATGAQWRRDATDVDHDEETNAYNLSFLTGDRDWTASRRSWALFSELHYPLSRAVRANIALRYENITSLGIDTIDPKIGLQADLSDSLVARASWGTSFKIGSLLQTGGSRTIFLNSSDPFSNAPSLAYRSSAATGNPDLQPEVADVVNVGFTWSPTRWADLKIELDYYDYQYSDLIVREGHQALIDQDNALRCPGGVNGDPAVGPLCGVWDDDGDGVATVFSIGDGIPDKVIRREDGYLVLTEATYLNASSMQNSGFDLSISHSWNTDSIGVLHGRVSLNRSLRYDLTNPQGVEIDGLESRNQTNSIGRPMPLHRIQGDIHWQRGRNSINMNIKRVSEYHDDRPQSAFLGAYIGFAETIGSMTTVDLNYRREISLPLLTEARTSFSVGAVNLLNQDPPLTQVDGAYDYYLHDPRGRIYFLRMNVDFAD